MDLRTVDGMKIDVLDPGVHNRDAGPDFLHARLRIEETLWAGNVEIHINSSDWIKHGHLDDRAYDNVILHVVYHFDEEIVQSGNSAIPTLEVKELIDYQSYRTYRAWLASSGFIPCEKLMAEVPKPVIISAVESAAVSRLERKSEDCRQHLIQTKGDLEESFYRVFMRALGMKVNALPFEQLAKSLPLSLLRKHTSNIRILEALFLGQAGFLESPDSSHPYVLGLKRDYDFLRSKFSLKPMPKSAWKLSRLRPLNFPQVRLVQAAQFFHQKHNFINNLPQMDSVDELFRFLATSLDSEFWFYHYTLESHSTRVRKTFGKDFLKHLVINAVVPFTFALAGYNKDISYKSRAIGLLEQLSPEKNSIIRKFELAGYESKSAFDSQGVVELKLKNCDRKKCLNCKIGIYLIRSHAKIGRSSK